MVYEYLVRPWLFRLDPEYAHHLALSLLEGWSVGGRACERVLSVRDPRLRLRLWCLDFRNPIGLASGLDKNGQATTAWRRFGFGFCEVGTVTRRPQVGNPKPRLFRLIKERALINRLGFNNDGALAVLDHGRSGSVDAFPIGINVGKNRDTPIDSSADDYLGVMEILFPIADYFVINVSSPNTPNLRDLLAADRIHMLVQAAVELCTRLGQQANRSATPVLIKVSPDFEGCSLERTVDAAMSAGVSGIVATNTTVSRNGISSPRASESGGLSGPPLRSLANHVVKRIFRLTQNRVPVIGVGGIANAEDAYERIRAGATLVQLYTALIYSGPTLVRKMNRGLLRLLERDRLTHVSEAVGLDAG